MSERFDSLDRHYENIKKLSITTTKLFWINAALSIAVFFVDGIPKMENFLMSTFIITTCSYFVVENYLTIFLIPNVEEKRRLHLLTNSFNIPLDSERTNKYYNNDLNPSILKLGANVFENSLFAEKVTREMAKKERKKVIIFGVIFLLAMIYRTTNIELISILAQTLFASTLLPAYIRLEVLHSKNKAIYESLYQLFLLHGGKISKKDEDTISAKLLDSFVKYESAKAYSGVQQDSKIFNEINVEYTEKWEEIKQILRINTK